MHNNTQRHAQLICQNIAYYMQTKIQRHIHVKRLYEKQYREARPNNNISQIINHLHILCNQYATARPNNNILC